MLGPVRITNWWSASLSSRQSLGMKAASMCSITGWRPPVIWMTGESSTSGCWQTWRTAASASEASTSTSATTWADALIRELFHQTLPDVRVQLPFQADNLVLGGSTFSSYSFSSSVMNRSALAKVCLRM